MKTVWAMALAVALTSGCCTSQRRAAHASTVALPPSPAEPGPGPDKPTPPGPAGGGGELAGGDVVVPLCEEKVTIGKKDTDVSVVVRKVVKTEPVSETLELRRETVVLERVPMEGDCNGDFTQKEFTFQLKREVPVVVKRAVAVGRVVVKKRTETVRKVITEQARKEEVVMDKLED